MFHEQIYGWNGKTVNRISLPPPKKIGHLFRLETAFIVFYSGHLVYSETTDIDFWEENKRVNFFKKIIMFIDFTWKKCTSFLFRNKLRSFVIGFEFSKIYRDSFKHLTFFSKWKFYSTIMWRNLYEKISTKDFRIPIWVFFIAHLPFYFCGKIFSQYTNNRWAKPEKHWREGRVAIIPVVVTSRFYSYTTTSTD